MSREFAAGATYVSDAGDRNFMLAASYLGTTPAAAVTADYWNPVDKTTTLVVSGDHKLATHGNSGAPYSYELVRSVKSYTTGKYCFRMTITTDTSGSCGPGIATELFDISGAAWIGSDSNCISALIGDNWYFNGGGAGFPVDPGLDKLVAVDLGAKKVWERPFAGGNWNMSATANPATGAEGADFTGITGAAYYIIVELAYDAVLATAALDTVLEGVTLPSGYSPWEAGGVTPPAMRGMKVWTGSAWAEKPLKVWTGSAWVQKPVKAWNGSAWV